MKLRRALSTLAVASMLVACGGQDGASSGTTLKDGDTIKIEITNKGKQKAIRS